MIIAGFAGVGKTTFCNKYKSAIDFVVMPFKYENFIERYAKCGGENIKADRDLILKSDWQYEYYDALLKTQEEYPNEIIVIPTDRLIMRWLTADCIPFTLVYPCMDAKQEYKKRYIERGNTEEFLDIFIGEWDSWITMMQEQKADVKIELQPNQFLSDVIHVPECTEYIADKHNYINQLLQQPLLITAKDTLLSNLKFIAVHKVTGKRIEFGINELDTEDGWIYIDKYSHFDKEDMEDIYLDFSKNSEYIFRLKRPTENECGLIKPMRILMAEAKSSCVMKVTFLNFTQFELDLENFLLKYITHEKGFKFDEFEIDCDMIRWKNSNAVLPYSRMKGLIKFGEGKIINANEGED